ncbi:hypothetical protein M501DRAFT_911405, partial [Patellaria atrata CBS 101060]
QQLNRACESCRSLKVRCYPAANSPNGQCQRCAKALRPCVFSAPQARRPRKKTTDSRVAELEKELQTMRALLRGMSGSNTSQPSSSASSKGQNLPSTDDQGGEQQRVPLMSSYGGLVGADGDSLSTPASGWASSSTDDSSGAFNLSYDASDHRSDVVDRGLISLDTAKVYFTVYNTELVSQFPLAVLPEEVTFEQIRRSKPVLWLAMIAAAALGIDLELSRKLSREIASLYAHLIFIRGEKRIELVQALIITVVYYHLPESGAYSQLYQLTHTAATMAIELGIASKAGSLRGRSLHSPISLDDVGLQGTPMGEIARLILTIYIFTSSLAIRMRRPNMLLFNNWMMECEAMLSQSPFLHDKRIASWAQLNRIAEEASIGYGFDDPTTVLRIPVSQMLAVVRTFDRRMEEWRRRAVEDNTDVYGLATSHSIIITIYEFLMDGGMHDAKQFENEYCTVPSPNDKPLKSEMVPSAVYLQATMRIINSAHNVLDIFLSVAPMMLRKISSALYFRVAYAVIVLLRISFTASTTALGDVLDVADLRAEQYLERLADAYQQASGPEQCRVPNHWLRVVQRLQQWYEQY